MKIPNLQKINILLEKTVWLVVVISLLFPPYLPTANAQTTPITPNSFQSIDGETLRVVVEFEVESDGAWSVIYNDDTSSEVGSLINPSEGSSDIGPDLPLSRIRYRTDNKTLIFNRSGSSPLNTWVSPLRSQKYLYLGTSPDNVMTVPLTKATPGIGFLRFILSGTDVANVANFLDGVVANTNSQRIFFSIGDLPISANDDTVVVKKNTPLEIDVLDNDNTISGTTLALGNNPSNGSIELSSSNTKITYTPDTDYVGSDSFTYTISSSEFEEEATVTVTVKANEAPTVSTVTETIDEDSSTVDIDITVTDDFTEKSNLTPAITQDPTKGSATFAYDSTTETFKLSYTPNANENGVDTITYTVTDEDSQTSTGEATITITPTADPLAKTPSNPPNYEYPSTPTTETFDISTHFSDPDTDTLYYTVEQTTDTTVATITEVTARTELTTANAISIELLSSGTTDFTVTVYDALTGGESITHTYTITVEGDDRPIITINNHAGTDAVDVIIKEGDEYTDAGATVLDPDDNTYSGEITTTITNPSGDEVDEIDTSVIGVWTVTYSASADADSKVPLEVSRTVTVKPDEAPTAPTVTETIDEDAPATEISLDITDDITENADLVLAITQAPTKGTASLEYDSTTETFKLSYTPNANVNGVDTIRYTVTDESNQVATGEVTITITSVNDAPELDSPSNPPEYGYEEVSTAPPSKENPSNPPNYEYTGKDTSKTFDISTHFSDPDTDTLYYTVEQTTDEAVATVTEITTRTELTTANAISIELLATGTTDFTVTVYDALIGGESITHTYTITVEGDNRPIITINPHALTDAIDAIIKEGEAYTDAGATVLDPDDSTYSGSISVTITNPDGDTVSAVDTSITGVWTITYSASADADSKVPLEVSRRVTVANEAPTVPNVTKTIDEDSSTVDITVNIEDDFTDKADLTIAITQEPTKGEATLTYDSPTETFILSYTPTEDENGEDTITYTATDGEGQTTTGEATITIRPIREVPETDSPSNPPEYEYVEVSNSPPSKESPSNPPEYAIGSGSKTFDISTHFSDGDTDTLYYTVEQTTDEAVATITEITTRTELTSTNTIGIEPLSTGTTDFTVTVYDSLTNGESITHTYTITVQSDNRPIITINPHALTDAIDVTIRRRATYTDAGATVADPDDSTYSEDVTTTITNPSGDTVSAVNTSTTGVWTITYSAPADSDSKVPFEVSRRVTVKTEGAPDAPLVRATIDEDSSVAEISVPITDDFTENSDLTLAITRAPSKGSASLEYDSSHDIFIFNYTPTISANGVDTIRYTVTDDGDKTSRGTIIITINPRSKENFDISTHFTDKDSTTLYYTTTQTTNPRIATVNEVTARKELTSENPLEIAPLFPGTTDFTVTVYDASSGGRSITHTYTITVGGDDRPVINVNNDGDNPVDVIIKQGEVYTDAGATVSDPDDSTYSEDVTTTITNPSGDIVSAVDTSITGVWILTYSAPADADSKTPLTVYRKVTVRASEIPIAPAVRKNIYEDSRKTNITIPITDDFTENADLTIAITQEPTKGSATFEYDSSTDIFKISYTPNSNEHGVDTIRYTVTDEEGQTATGEVKITIISIADPIIKRPSNPPNYEYTVGDTSKTFDISTHFSDEDTDTLYYTVEQTTDEAVATVTEVTRRTELTSANVIRIKLLSSGTADFTVTVYDAPTRGTSITHTYTITVDGDNRPIITINPHALTDAVDVVIKQGDEYIDAGATVVDPDDSTYSEDITVTITNPDGETSIPQMLLRLPITKIDTSINGVWIITYSAPADADSKVPLEVSRRVTVKANEAPTAPTLTEDIYEDSPTTEISIPITDDLTENSDLIIEITQEPTKGSASLEYDSSTDTFILSYTPTISVNGEDSIIYTVTDEEGETSTGTITININPHINIKQIFDISTHFTDQDNTKLYYTTTQTTNPRIATVNVVTTRTELTSENPLTIAPLAPGTTDFTVTVYDSLTGGESTTHTYTITVNADDLSVAPTITETIDEDSPTTEISIPITDSFTDNTNLTLDITQESSKGTSTIEYDSSTDTFILSYTPTANANGIDTVVYTVTDEDDNREVGVVIITITPVDDVPTVSGTPKNPPLYVATTGVKTFDIADDFIDIDGDQLTYEITAPSATKALADISIDGSVVNITPNKAGTGEFTITATDTDGGGTAVSHTYTLTIDPWFVPDEKLVIFEDSPQLTIPLDFGTGFDTVSISSVGTPTKGTVTFTGTDIFYTPNQDEHGTDSFTYTSGDGTLTRDGTITITIISLNDAPTISIPEEVRVRAGETSTINIDATDVDGDLLGYVLVDPIPDGATIDFSTGVISYTPSVLIGGTQQTFIFEVLDGIFAVRESITVTVEAVVSSAPRDLTADGGNKQIELSWSPMSNIDGLTITGYKIERSVDGTTGWEEIVPDTGNTNTIYIDTGLESGKRYYYRVSTVTSIGIGLASVVTSALTDPPDQTTEQQTPQFSTSINNQIGYQGIPLNLDLPRATGGQGAITYVVTGLPVGLEYDADNHKIIKSTNKRGNHIIVVEAFDESQVYASNPLRFEIEILEYVDYDTDDDGLIEIESVEQFSAIRFDLDGNGKPSLKLSTTRNGELVEQTIPSRWRIYRNGLQHYNAAFPGMQGGIGCLNEQCIGYELKNDIDLDSTGDGWLNTEDGFFTRFNPDINPRGIDITYLGAGWDPIGTFSLSDKTTFVFPYDAIFNGNGYKLKNFFIDSAHAGTSHNRAIFGELGETGVIRNVGVDNVQNRSLDNKSAGLVSVNRGSIFNTYVTGRVEGQHRVGALVAENEGTIATSYSTAYVKGVSSVGGLVGENTGTILSSFATGSVFARQLQVLLSVTEGKNAGGLVGVNEGEIVASYAKGEVSAEGKGRTGGLVGHNTSGTITNSYYDTDTSSQSDTTSPSNKTTSQLQTPTSYSGIYQNWNIDTDNSDGDSTLSTGVDSVWDFGTSSEYPALKIDFDGDGTATVREFDRHRPFFYYTINPYTETSNTSGTRATTGDTITVVFAVSEPLTEAPIVTIVGTEEDARLVDVNTNQYEATYTVTEESPQGKVWYQIGEMVSTQAQTQAQGIIPADYNLPGYFNPVPSAFLPYVRVTESRRRMGNIIITNEMRDSVPVANTPIFEDEYSDQVAYVSETTNIPLPTAVGGALPLSYSVVGLAGIQGLRYDRTDHTIKGTPISTASATIDITVTDDDTDTTATDTDTISFTLNVRERIDYDTDDDGFIEISNLEQFNALRYDLNTDGVPELSIPHFSDFPEESIRTQREFFVAFPHSQENMGCPNTGCTGYELTADIDFDTNGDGEITEADKYWNGGSGWAPLGRVFGLRYLFPFIGHLDGNGHILKNFYLDNTLYNGIISRVGYLGHSGRIENLGVENVIVDSNYNQAGGLVSLLSREGVISKVYVTGSVRGSRDVGGVVGANQGTIIASYADVAVNGYRDSGGLVGENDTTGRIIASYSMGTVRSRDQESGGLVGDNKGSIIASYSRSPVTTSRLSGGLVGNKHREGTVVNSYYDRDESTQSDTAFGARKTTNQLQTPTSYTGIYQNWNVDIDNSDGDDVLSTGGDSVWDFGTSQTYPALKLDVNKDGTATIREFGPQQDFVQITDITLTTDSGSRDVSVGDSITLKFTTNEALTTNPTVTIVEQTITATPVTGEEHTYRAVYRVSNTSPRGLVTYSFGELESAFTGRNVILPADEVARESDIRITSSTSAPTFATNVVEYVVAFVGVAFQQALPSITGGDGVIRHSVTGLPDGLAYNTGTNTIEGTPTTVGSHTVTIVITDSDTDTHFDDDTISFNMDVESSVDYDLDDDGLIEISTVEQLNAIRFDLDGDGVPSVAYLKEQYDSGSVPTPFQDFSLLRYYPDGVNLHNQAFPGMNGPAGCPNLRCIGYELTSDLNYATSDYTEFDYVLSPGSKTNGWEPIGSSYSNLFSTPYTGVFDGNGYALKNFSISWVGAGTVHWIGGRSEPTVGGHGIFSRLGETGVIRNVAAVNIDNVGHQSIKGSLVGHNEGKIIASYATGVVSGRNDIGGLVGKNEGEIIASYAKVRVPQGSYAWIRDGENRGGLVGHNSGTILASYAVGLVSGQESASNIGGLVGYNEGEIIASFANGSVSTSGRGSIGGLVGDATGGTITNSYYDTDTSGQNDATSGSKKTTNQLQTPTSYSGIYQNWNVDIDNSDGDDVLSTGGDSVWDFGTNNVYPALKVDFDNDGVATVREFDINRPFFYYTIPPRITTDNTSGTHARAGDSIHLTFETNEVLAENPTVIIADTEVVARPVTGHSGRYRATHRTVESDPQGFVRYKIGELRSGEILNNHQNIIRDSAFKEGAVIIDTIKPYLEHKTEANVSVAFRQNDLSTVGVRAYDRNNEEYQPVINSTTTGPNGQTSVDTYIPGTYTTVYSATADQAGNVPDTLTQTVVVGTNQPPRAPNERYIMGEDAKRLVITPMIEDAEGVVRIYSVTGAQKGSVQFDDRRIIYTPNKDANGEDRLTYSVEDIDGIRATGVIRIRIISINDVPRITAELANPTPLLLSPRVSRFSIASHFSELGAGAITYEITEEPRKTIAYTTITNDVLTITPIGEGVTAVSVTGIHSATGTSVIKRYRISTTTGTEFTLADDSLITTPDTVSPTPLSVAGATSTTFDIDGHFTDAEDATLQYEITEEPWDRVAQASITGSTVTLTPVGIGDTEFTVTATDSGGKSVQVTYTIQVNLEVSPSVVSITTSSDSGVDGFAGLGDKINVLIAIDRELARPPAVTIGDSNDEFVLTKIPGLSNTYALGYQVTRESTEGLFSFNLGELIGTSINTTPSEIYPRVTDMIIEVSAPEAPVLDLITEDDRGVSSLDNITNKWKDLTIRVYGEVGSRIDLFQDSVNVGRKKLTTNSADFTVTLSEGTHTFTAVALDSVGTRSDVSDPLNITVDTTPPAISRQGLAALFLAKGEDYTDLGATVADLGNPNYQGHTTVSVENSSGEAVAMDDITDKSDLYVIKYEAPADAAGNVVIPVLRLVVVSSNRAPTASPVVLRIIEDSPTATIHPTISDPDGDTFSITSVQGGLLGSAVIGSDQISIEYTPLPNRNGTDIIRYVLTDEHGASRAQRATITILNELDAPTIVAPDSITATVGEHTYIDFDFQTVDSLENVVVRFSLVGATQSSISIDERTGIITYTPTTAEIEEQNVTVRLVVGSLSVQKTVNITVVADNIPPNIIGVPLEFSDNTNTALAKEGDTVSIVFGVNEPLSTTPTINIGGTRSSTESVDPYILIDSLYNGSHSINHNNTDIFGSSVTLDGDKLIVTQMGDSNSIVYSVDRVGGVWGDAVKILERANTGESDSFGHSVALNGEILVIGAPHHGANDKGAVFIYTLNENQLTLVHTITDGTNGLNLKNGEHFGSSITFLGDTLAVGAPSPEISTATGFVYLFEQSGTQWSNALRIDDSTQVVDIEAGDAFGSSVSGDDDTLVVGASGDNTVHILEKVGTQWQLNHILDADSIGTSLQTNDRFGASVSLTTDGLYVGAPYDDTLGTDKGAVYTFREVGDEWIFRDKIDAQTVALGLENENFFGHSVTASGTDLVITAPSGSVSGNAVKPRKVYILSSFETDFVYRFDYTITSSTPNGVVAYTVGEMTDTHTNTEPEETQTRSASVTVDTTKPILSLIGDASIELNTDEEYTELGVTVSDNGVTYRETTPITRITNSNGDAIEPEDVTNNVDSYTVSYTISDSAGNISDTITRAITVINAFTLDFDGNDSFTPSQDALALYLVTQLRISASILASYVHDRSTQTASKTITLINDLVADTVNIPLDFDGNDVFTPSQDALALYLVTQLGISASILSSYVYDKSTVTASTTIALIDDLVRLTNPASTN